MTSRRQHQLVDQLRRDEEAVSAAAAWVREQPAVGTVAALSDPRIATLCADLLDRLAELCGQMDPPAREHLVRVAREFFGDRWISQRCGGPGDVGDGRLTVRPTNS